MKTVLNDTDLSFAESIRRLNATNPFLPDRIACEREALGADFVEAEASWNTRPPAAELHPHHARLRQRCEIWLQQVSSRWPKTGKAPIDDKRLFTEVVGFWLYQRYAVKFDDLIRRGRAGEQDAMRPAFYRSFKEDTERYFGLPGLDELGGLNAPHLFACAFQIRRAFHHVFHYLVGGSLPMARLRAAIWQSVFSHDLARYRRVLFNRMGDFATLITGSSGTGKELVAQAIAFSRYVPFEPRKGGFSDSFAAVFFPLNLSALSPTLIESELFGHRRGSFTGATGDRVGWMEQCPETGVVFLDEIGDVDTSVQVKLLRVLQSRTFQRLGETEDRKFIGKIVAATNQDLARRMETGEFREDFYYRLCSDIIRTPTLREQLDASPEDLAVMINAIAARLVGPDEQASFGRQAVHWSPRAPSSQRSVWNSAPGTC